MSGVPEEWTKERIDGQTTNPESKKTENKNLRNFSLDSMKKAINSIDFGIKSTQKNEKLTSYLNKKGEGNSSIEGQLANNEQVQLLLSEILSDYNNYIGKDKEQLKTMIQHEKLQIPEEQSQIIESMYEYMLSNDNLQGFEDYIKSNGIYVVRAYFSKVPVDKDGKLTFYSKNEIKARLKIGWFINLYKGYREKYVENNDDLTKLEQEMKQFNDVASFIKNSIDVGINQFLGGEIGKDGLVQYLNEFLISAKKNEKLKNLIDGKDKNSIIGVIRRGIKEYARLLNISDENPQLRESSDGDKVFDMQIRSYLYLYGLIAFPDKFDSKKGLDEKELGNALKGILVNEGVIKDDGEDKDGYVKYERELRKNQIKQDITRRKESWTRIQSMKNKNLSGESQLGNKEKSKITDDINVATGVEIAGELGLGRKIKIKRKEFGDVLENPLLKRNVLKKTGKDFVGENLGILSRYFNISEISRFFGLGKSGVSFNESTWEIFKNKWISEHPESNVDELGIVKQKLLDFPRKYDENLAKAGDLVNEKMDKTHETVKNYAIGAIIDNIKDMFQYIVDTNTTGTFMTGFEFDENNSAKIENNCLILSGRFNGEVMNIKYDLESGKLYMNSLIDITKEKITISGNNAPISEIGELQPFGHILDEFYKTPTESMKNNVIFPLIKRQPLSRGNENTNGGEQGKNQPPRVPSNTRLSNMRDKLRNEHKIMFQKMCGTKIDEIGWKIRDKIEFKTSREPVALNLLRTLGIMPIDNSRTKNIMRGSDLYRIVQLITTKENTTESINKFSEYMKVFMNMIGLDWGKNSGHQDKERNDDSKKIFNKNYVGTYISDVREFTENFDVEYQNTKNTDQLDKAGDSSNENESTPNKNKSQFNTFGICKIIEKHFTNGGTYPNRALDYNKIENFKKGLSNDLASAGDKAVADNLVSPEILDNYYT